MWTKFPKREVRAWIPIEITRARSPIEYRRRLNFVKKIYRCIIIRVWIKASEVYAIVMQRKTFPFSLCEKLQRDSHEHFFDLKIFSWSECGVGTKLSWAWAMIAIKLHINKQVLPLQRRLNFHAIADKSWNSRAKKRHSIMSRLEFNWRLFTAYNFSVFFSSRFTTAVSKWNSH